MKSPFPRNRPLRRTSSALAAGLLATQPLPASAPRHVILVHGIWDTFRTMEKMECRLRDAGFDPLVVTLAPNNGKASLDALGEQVHRQIEARLPPGVRFSIVGFSMGGLVARSYLRQFGEPERVATFVSIASPHRGTWMAWLSGAPGVRDMRAGSAFLAAIDADAARFSSTRWVTIRTPFDLMILPSGNSVLSWAENHSIPVLLHPLLVLDNRVLDCTIRALGADPASTKSVREPPASPHAGSPRPQSPGIPRRR
jgi:triacylglycerol lipase